MPIIRFEDEAGEVHWGEERADGTAALFDGDPVRGGAPTGEIAAVGRLMAPVVPSAIFGIGLNYRRHAAETGQELPRYPVVFMKPTWTVIGPGDAIRLPACQLKGPEVDYECELAVVIGRVTRNVPEDRALDHVFGYTCGNDVSARRWQKWAGAGQWVRGKSFDTFCPLGPRLLTTAEIPDPQDLAISTTLNGETMQSSNTADMIFTVAQLVSFLSQDTTLAAGSLIMTGTPEGVGFVRKPPIFLAPGDEVTIELERIGALTNPVLAADG